MPLHLLFRWNHLNSFSISVSSYTSFSNHLFKGCDRPWWVSFANKIVKALLKHNHHKLYISGRVMELSSGYNCSVLAWSNFVNQTCFFELINQVTNLTTQVKLLFGFTPEGLVFKTVSWFFNIPITVKPVWNGWLSKSWNLFPIITLIFSSLKQLLIGSWQPVCIVFHLCWMVT